MTHESSKPESKMTIPEFIKNYPVEIPVSSKLGLKESLVKVYEIQTKYESDLSQLIHDEIERRIDVLQEEYKKEIMKRYGYKEFAIGLQNEMDKFNWLKSKLLKP